MNERPFEAPEWFRALTLKERAASLWQGPGGDPGPPVDPQRAERRGGRWRSQLPFSRDGFFTRRLASDGLSEASFRYLLGEPAEDLARRAGGAQDWLRSLAEAFSTDATNPFPPPSLREGAGCILCLLRLWEQRPSLETLAAAVRCGERLLARAVPAGPGIGWVLAIAGPHPLAGMSHGTAGIAGALLQLSTAAGDERFRRAALEGLAYERSLYAPEERNWPDLRNTREDGEPFFMNGWCHGAPGIGLARLGSLRHLEGLEVREEITAAVETRLADGFGLSHCLCHGDLGNLDLLILAREALGLDLTFRIGGLLGSILADARAHGWRFGLPGRTEPPGLMLGLAGIGYGLLRAAEPRVPSVLILAPPPAGISDLADLHPGSSRLGVSERSTDDEQKD